MNNLEGETQTLSENKMVVVKYMNSLKKELPEDWKAAG